ncbi:DUF3135 domain-containing protein [Saccharophagus sp. K07]|jgi:hypothetical protein|uniref:DUF3135 domain-containing protein n=1 Tax=Saccharophagus sp. K07 TaxID=2283636 RepID=UPI001651DD73|nr:DUF3135 domain-containing protein [Saccharophagus sp. K07]MBC6903859.1 DUF3135 domain-containing protein [Saccharophagus sp. K07]
MSGLDIEYLFELAKRDPEELESWRLREIEKLINSAPETLRHRLRGLQFQIDCKRRLHPTPMGACIAISQMMMDSLLNLRLSITGEGISPLKPARAQVIPMGASRSQMSMSGHAP